MINDRMKTYDLETRSSGYNEYGEPKTGFEFTKEVDVSVSLITKVINELDPRYIASTHIGLTYDRTILEDMRLVNADIKYLVKIVNGDARMVQLTLEEVI